MKLSAILVLLLVITGSLASKSTYQPKLTASLTLKDKLAQSKFGSAILGMVQVANSSDLDFDELFDALDLLREQLQTSQQAELDDFAADEQAYNANSARLTRLINQYEAQIVQFQDELAALQKEEASLADNHKQLIGQLAVQQSNLQNEEGLLQSLTENFEQDVSDYQEVLSLLDQALEKLREAQSSSNSISFIQTGTEKISTLGNKLNEKLVKTKASASITKPIQLFFAQLSSGSAQSSGISQAITALENLQDFYIEGLEGLQSDFTIAQAQHQNLINQYKVAIGTLTSVDIPAVEQQIEANSDALEAKAGLLAQAKSNSAQEQANLQAAEAEWAARQEIHEILMPQYENELEIVDQAEALLKQQA